MGGRLGARLVLVAVLLGLVMSFSTGVRPAGAQTAPRTRDPLVGSQSDFSEWFINDLTAAQLGSGLVACNASVTAAGYVTQFSPVDLVPEDEYPKGVWSGLSTACVLGDFVVSDTGADRIIRLITTSDVMCEVYVEQRSLDGETVLSDLGYRGRAEDGVIEWVAKSLGRYRVKVQEYDGGPATCGIVRIEGGVVHPVDAGAAEPPPEAGAFVPRLACGRMLRDMGNGQWFADAEAIVRNPPGPGASDSQGFWYSSWDPMVDFDTGKKVTFPLPTGATSNDSLWVTYVMERTYTVPIGWRAPSPTEGVKAVEVETKGGVVIPGVSWIISAVTKVVSDQDEPAEQRILDELVGSGTMTLYVDADEVGDDVAGEPEVVTAVRKVKATCTMRVSPVTNHTDPPVIVVNAPAHSGDTTIINDDDVVNNFPPPGSESADSTCGGGSWWNPVTWAKSLFCGIKDVFGVLENVWEWISDLLATLLSWIVPDVGGWFDDVEAVRTASDGRVPFSWLGDLTDAGQQLAGFRASESACGLVLDGWNPSDGPDPVLPTSGDPACAGGALGSSGTTSFGLVRSALSLFIWAGAFGVMWRSAPWNKGKSAGEPGVFE